MKFKGEPNLYVRIRKPKQGEVKGFYFDENGLYETINPITIKRLQANFKQIEQIEKGGIENVSNDIKLPVKERRSTTTKRSKNGSRKQ